MSLVIVRWSERVSMDNRACAETRNADTETMAAKIAAVKRDHFMKGVYRGFGGTVLNAGSLSTPLGGPRCF
jgi:hypothetical protein